MKHRMQLIVAMVMAMTLLLATACGNGPQVLSQGGEPVLSGESLSGSAHGPVFQVADNPTNLAILLTDQAGREVRLEAPAERIVSGYYISSSACIALGLADKLVGIEAKADSRPIYAMAAPEILALPNVGSAKEFNLEGCLALNPELVILPKRLADSANTISDMGIPVLLVNPESLQELMEMIALIGQATGTDDIAARLLRYYEDELAAIATLSARVIKRPRVYMGSNSTYLATAPAGMYQSELIEAAGGINAAGELEGDSWVEVSYEQLLALNPDVIILPSEASYRKDDLLSDTQLTALTAVRNNAVYQMPKDFEAWDSPTTSCMIGIRWLLSVLHEDLYDQQSLEEDAAMFYQSFYGVRIDTALIGK